MDAVCKQALSDGAAASTRWRNILHGLHVNFSPLSNKSPSTRCRRCRQADECKTIICNSAPRHRRRQLLYVKEAMSVLLIAKIIILNIALMYNDYLLKYAHIANCVEIYRAL